MRIVVVGGSGLIGDKVMTALHDAGHKAVAASPAFGIDAFTGEGLDEAMAGAEVVVDVSNAPDWEDDKVLRFFSTVTRNALEAGRRVGARHHVALSVMGCDRLPESGYMRAKVAQEELIRGAQVPFTIVHATQFMEFLARIAGAGTDGDVVHVPDARVQPVAAVEVARFVAAVATKPPRRAWSRSPVPNPSRSMTRSPASWPRSMTAAVESWPTRRRGTSAPRCGTASCCRGRRRTSRPSGSPTGWCGKATSESQPPERANSEHGG